MRGRLARAKQGAGALPATSGMLTLMRSLLSSRKQRKTGMPLLQQTCLIHETAHSMRLAAVKSFNRVAPAPLQASIMLPENLPHTAPHPTALHTASQTLTHTRTRLPGCSLIIRAALLEGRAGVAPRAQHRPLAAAAAATTATAVAAFAAA